MAYSRDALSEGQKHHDAASEHEVPHPSSPTRPSTTRRGSLTGWTWTLETLFLVLAIGALAALVAVNLTVQDESIEAWRDRHPKVSINTIVAIISALLTGSCMFVAGQVMGQAKWQWFGEPQSLTDFARIDRASRGPWGSLLLLCRLRAQTLARVAAITTLIAVAVNPFAQNIIATRQCQLTSPNEETIIPTADNYVEFQNWKPRTQNPGPGDFALWGIDRVVPRAAIKASVYSGVWGASTTDINSSTITLPPSDVNRRYPRYSTLGICHKCADISSSVEKVCDSTIAEDDGGVFSPQCKWSLPTGQWLHNYADSEAYFRMMNSSIADISINYAMVNSTTQSIALPHISGTFTNVTFLINATSDPECTTSSGNNCGNPVGVPTMELNTIAAECSLFPCTRTYTASIVNGSLAETEVQRTLSTTDWLKYDRPGGEWRQGPDVRDIEISPDDNCTWYGPSYTSRNRGPFSTSCHFRASAVFIMSLGDFFWSFWNGTVAGRHWQDSSSTNDVLDAFWSGGLTNFTHIDNVLGSIADSMTSVIRRTGRIYERNLVDADMGGQGTVSAYLVKDGMCVEVRWGWIAVPAAVVAATAVLLLWTIINSRSSEGRPVWKASALPILFHGPDTTKFPGGKKLSTLQEMEKEASGVMVRLSNGVTGSVGLETFQQ